MNLCNYNWNVMNLRMIGVIEFDIIYARDKGGFLYIFGNIHKIHEKELMLIFHRNKGEKFFWLCDIFAYVIMGNREDLSYHYFRLEDIDKNIPTVKVLERLFLNWNPGVVLGKR